MSERFAFIQACLDRRERIVDICARFGISEKTGHKILHRFREGGVAGLESRSHAPHHQPHRMTAEVETRVLALRKKYPKYGAEKLRDWLVQHEPTVRWPAASSIGALLARKGLIHARRRHAPAHRQLDTGRTVATAPNEVWTADFKGEFRLRSGPYCYPLTVLDLYAHFLLDCRGLATTAVAPVRVAFTRLFREYGLPDTMRTDNGGPFAHPNALGRLGTLAYWWVRLGIRPEHTRPATPSENGAHERFHKTLKAATACPASTTPAAQQRRFDRFRREYNTDRPHAGLPGHVPPATLYTPAWRPYPDRLPALIYSPESEVRLVSRGGAIKWRDHAIFLTTCLAGEYVGLSETEADRFTVRYGALALGEVEAPQHRFTPCVRWIDE